MGAGSSTEQRSPEPPAGSDTPSELEMSGHGPAGGAPGAAEDPAAADPASKLPQNGQLSTVNGVAEQGDVQVQEGTQDGQEEEVTVEDVGQRESEDVREKDRVKEMAANSAVAEDITKEGQEETPEILEQIPASEHNAEEMAQPAEPQANDVGFKKVFKFVGFKFTVKKDKNEKSDTVQLLTVKKDDGEGAEASVGAGDHQESTTETKEESAPKESELKQSTEKPEDTLKQAQSSTGIPVQAESGQATEEEAKDDEKQDKEPTKSSESPTSPVSSETTSSFKKFFTHGWAGWRKKTSFKKPKEDDLETSEKKKEQEAEKVEEEEKEKPEEGPAEPAPASEPQEATEGTSQARLSADYEKVELPLEDQVGDLEGSQEEKCAPLATEVFDDKVEGHQEVVAEVHVSNVGKVTEEQEGGEEAEGDVQEKGECLPPEKLAEAQEAPKEAEPAEELVKSREVCVSGGDHTQLTDLSPDEKVPPRHPEGVVSEADMLSSQERIKVQGSPLKKLFSSSGLKKLSGKKHKGKRGGGGDEEPGEQQQAQSESPESADEQKGESSASSPEEPEEITCLEKGLSEAQQEGEPEEGATSDGEKKREGITPWASFKKMVTPKKRVRRPSESDKEEELDKVKSATLSSTESTVSEMQEEVKAVGDEQKPEEPKRKVDASVSWEALICVGSSKKRARKASSSDDEGGPRTVGGDGHRAEETGKDKEAGTDAAPASTQEQDQVQGSSSPEPAGSPSEGEGVSTWESFKRLVTPRKKSKSKLEEKTEDSTPEQLASDVEPSREESWVSIKKLIPGRRKKRLDGKQDQAAVEDSGPVEVNEDDPDVPAVVPLSEYDAVEREKMEVQQAQESAEVPQLQGPVYVSEELSKTLVHTVSVAVIDGTRAVTSVEERSPSWISASVTEPLEHAEDEATPPVEVTEREVFAEETPASTQTLPEGKDAHDDTVASEVDFTSEAMTAAETTDALRTEEATEASGAEETTDMVSAVSQLTDSPDTTEEATPVQEVEGGGVDPEDRERQTQAILQAVAEKVKEESQAPAAQAAQRAGPIALEKVDEVEEDSEVQAVGKEGDVVSEEPKQETEAEHFAQASEVVQAAPENLEEVPEVLVGPELKESVTTCQALKPQQLMEQAVAPESSETLTDSETNGSTPLAGSDTQDVMQDETVESQDSNAFAAVGQAQATEAEAPAAQGEEPSTPPHFPPQEESGEKPERDDVLEPTQQELSVEAALVLAKTEVGQEVPQIDGEKDKGGLCAEELEVSVDTDEPDSQVKMAEVTRDGEVTGASCQENESIEVQGGLSPEERETGTDVDKDSTMETKPEQVSEEHEQKTATPENEDAYLQPDQTAGMPDSERGEAVSSLDASSSLPDQDKAGSLEVQIQSFDTPVTQTALAAETVETVKVSETDESLECVAGHITPVEQSSAKDDHCPPQQGEDTGPLEPESKAEAAPATPPPAPAPERALHPDLQGERSPSQKQRPKDDEQIGADGKESAAREEVLDTEAKISEFESESSRLVQNIIQTAVDQFACTETAPATCAADTQAQVPETQADSQGSQQMPGKDGCRQASTHDEVPTAAAQDGLVISDISKGMGETSEKMSVPAAESAGVKDQHCEGVIVSLKAKGDGKDAKRVPGDACAKLELFEKPPPEYKGQKGHATDGPQHQSLQAEGEASANLTKESPDTNGLKLKEDGDVPEVGIQEENMPTEPAREVRPQTEEDLQEPKGDLAES
ncbi:A-kinase anchor protein 12 isoform X1 [Psammomys obesus]|uniref:A-kinase anchor protein 12 isoform X1 n=1 Tax=Psammomys obesus TaxID=48139 RepID=UPI002452EB8A|nr:A-kinase anchor protein 12 isoform X1 [Psammomys obesus]